MAALSTAAVGAGPRAAAPDDLAPADASVRWSRGLQPLAPRDAPKAYHENAHYINNKELVNVIADGVPPR